jgi:hypothetical protein
VAYANLLTAGDDLECGDLSPLWSLDRLVGQAEPRSAAPEDSRCALFDGDKSPAESGENSPHSKDNELLTTDNSQ